MNHLLLLLCAIALVGCAAAPAPDDAPGDLGAWGPLAVSLDASRDVLDARGGGGPIQITDRCVFLQSEEVAGRETTLVWRSGQTGWDPANRQVVFESATGELIRLSDGDRIEIGGAGIADPDDPDQGAPQPAWLVRPDPTCPRELWAVHSIRRLER